MRYFSFKALIYPAFLFSVVIICSCGKGSSPKGEGKSTSKSITGFSLKKADGSDFATADISVSIVGDSVLITLPATTDISNLVPNITIDAVTISPANGISQNFSSPVTYTLTAGDGTTKMYFVAVHRGKFKSILFVSGQNQTLYALNSLNGSLIWKTTADKDFAPPIFYNGMVLVGNANAYMYAFDAATGNLKWKNGLGEQRFRAIMAGARVCFVSGYSIVALDAETGTYKWGYSPGGMIRSELTYVDNVIYITSADGFVHAINAADGTLKWKHQIGINMALSGVSVANGVAYLGGYDGFFYALNANDGTEKWKLYFDKYALYNCSAAVKDGRVYFITGEYIGYDPAHTIRGSLNAVQEADGKFLWRSLDNVGFFASGPVIANDKLYINGDDGKLYAINPLNGSILWSKAVATYSTLPVVSDNIVYPGGGGSGFYAGYDAATGDEKWKFPITGSNGTSRAFVVDANGNY